MKKTVLLFLCATVASLTVPAQTNAPAKKPVARGGNTTILADHGEFELLGRRMVYTGHVHINDPDMKLQCAKITATMPSGSGHPNRIVAESTEAEPIVSNDVLDDHGETNHVTGHLAVYEYTLIGGTTNETVTVTGDPHINTPSFQGTADELKWNRATGHMSASNPNFTATGQFDSVLAHTNAPASK